MRGISQPNSQITEAPNNINNRTRNKEHLYIGGTIKCSSLLNKSNNSSWDYFACMAYEPMSGWSGLLCQDWLAWEVHVSAVTKIVQLWLAYQPKLAGLGLEPNTG